MIDDIQTLIGTWSVLIGVLLTVMAFSSSLLKRIPLSGAAIYLFVGFTLGASGLQFLNPLPAQHAPILERIAECALLISLFSAGLKLRVPLRDKRWHVSLQLATTAMVITIAALAALGVALGLSVGAAILLGAILAPTDPVLASDVQVENVKDTDRLRFSLTGESGLNDGTAFPFVILGLTVLHLHSNANLAHWFAVEVVWSAAAGVAIGVFFGSAVGRIVLYLRTQHKEAVGLDEFLVLGLIAFVYGCALLLHASTFLAVFCAGLAMTRTTELRQTTKKISSHDLDNIQELATDPEHAGPVMMRAVIGFNQQLERIAEVAVVILVGALLPVVKISLPVCVLIAALIFIIRPLAVQVSLIHISGLSAQEKTSRSQRWLISWFGVRGIGSIYYLFYSINHGLSESLTVFFSSVVIGVVAISIIVHGISVTPLMKYYEKRARR